MYITVDRHAIAKNSRDPNSNLPPIVIHGEQFFTAHQVMIEGASSLVWDPENTYHRLYIETNEPVHVVNDPIKIPRGWYYLNYSKIGNPPITVRRTKSGKVSYCRKAVLRGPSWFVYNKDKPILSCGARMVLVTPSPVELVV